jgi:hypothetical protein
MGGIWGWLLSFDYEQSATSHARRTTRMFTGTPRHLRGRASAEGGPLEQPYRVARREACVGMEVHVASASALTGVIAGAWDAREPTSGLYRAILGGGRLS